jgi:hypothetical protein
MPATTIAHLLEHGDLDDRDVATWWAERYGDDVASAVAECPHAAWLAVIASELGQDRAVDGWWSRRLHTPERDARFAELAKLGARERTDALVASDRPSRAEMDAAIDDLRAALDVDAMRARLASYPSDETAQDRRGARGLARAPA